MVCGYQLVQLVSRWWLNLLVRAPAVLMSGTLGYVNTGLTTLKAATERLAYNYAERLEIIRFVFFMEKNHGTLIISWIQTFYSYYSKYWTMRCTTGNPQRRAGYSADMWLYQQ